MVIKENESCVKCKKTPFEYDIIKIYKEKIEGQPKRRIRCRNCKKEYFLPYIVIKQKEVKIITKKEVKK